MSKYDFGVRIDGARGLGEFVLGGMRVDGMTVATGFEAGYFGRGMRVR
jgi:hypothetical protein